MSREDGLGGPLQLRVQREACQAPPGERSGRSVVIQCDMHEVQPGEDLARVCFQGRHKLGEARQRARQSTGGRRRFLGTALGLPQQTPPPRMDAETHAAHHDGTEAQRPCLLR